MTVHTVIALAVLLGLCWLLWRAFHVIPLRDLAVMPARARLWRREGRRWRRYHPPPPRPGTEAAEWLEFWQRIRREHEARAYAYPRRRTA